MAKAKHSLTLLDVTTCSTVPHHRCRFLTAACVLARCCCCRFLHARTWENAPVEITRIFHQRVKAFMDKMLKANSGQRGLLGRITNYVVRYEVCLPH